MNDCQIRWVSALIAVIGLALLAWFAANETPKQTAINSITNESVSSKVIVKGKVLWSSYSNGVIVFELSDNGKIKGVMTRPGTEDLEAFRAGNWVQVTGAIEEYRNEIEINAREAEKIA